jgi:methionyl-tRNA formyltransferase
MRMVKELDAGPAFADASRPIGPDENSPAVEADLALMGAKLLAEVVDQIAAGRATETPQDETKVTYAPKITKAESALDWSLPAAQIHNLVRGLQPWPLVAVRVLGERILLHRTSPTEELVDALPGSVIRADGDRLDVAAGDGRVLSLLAVQPEGRRVMSSREFLAGRRIAPGIRLEQG